MNKQNLTDGNTEVCKQKMSAVFGVWLRKEQMHEKDRVLRWTFCVSLKMAFSKLSRNITSC